MIDPWTIIAGIVAVIGAVAAAFWRGRKSAQTSQKAKERDAYEQHLEDIADAHDARNRAGSVQPDDKYRRG